MLRITVEIIPGGDIIRKRIIGVMHIINRGDGTPKLGNYDVYEMEDTGKMRRLDGEEFEKIPRVRIWEFLTEIFARRRKFFNSI